MKQQSHIYFVKHPGVCEGRKKVWRLLVRRAFPQPENVFVRCRAPVELHWTGLEDRMTCKAWVRKPLDSIVWVSRNGWLLTFIPIFFR